MAGRSLDTLLGTGWGFPPEFRELTHSVRMVSGVADIKESLFILLSTMPGERVMLPRYGCDLNRFVFREASASMKEELRDTVVTAIGLWEKRIDVLDCTVAEAREPLSTLTIAVTFRVRGTNSTDNVVYPLRIGDSTPRLQG